MSLSTKEWRTARAIQRIWGLIDKDKIEEAAPWLQEQADNANYRLFFDWCYDQLEKKEQAAIIRWMVEQVPDSEAHSVQLQTLEDKYKEGGHNLNAWKAIDWCRKYELPFPEWVIEYLSSTASKMLDKSTEAAPQKVYKAVGVEGWEFSRLRSSGKDLDLCRKIEQLLNEDWGKGGRTVTKARADVAKTVGMKADTVRKIHGKAKKMQYYPFSLTLQQDKVAKKS